MLLNIRKANLQFEFGKILVCQCSLGRLRRFIHLKRFLYWLFFNFGSLFVILLDWVLLDWVFLLLLEFLPFWGVV